MTVAPRSSELERSYRYVEAWGMATGTYGRVLLPRTTCEIQGALALENSFNRVGLDHVVLVKVATTAARRACGVAVLPSWA